MKCNELLCVEPINKSTDDEVRVLALTQENNTITTGYGWITV